MEAVSSGWCGPARAALLLLQAHEQAALWAADWVAYDAAMTCRRLLARELRQQAESVITEGVLMNSWWCLHHLGTDAMQSMGLQAHAAPAQAEPAQAVPCV